MTSPMVINGRPIGPDQPPYIIAELSGNHNGDLDRALKLIEVAAEQGADALKIQTYTPDTMTINCDRDEFLVKGGLWDGYTLYDLYQWAHTPWEWHEALFNKANEVGITMFSTPFDETAVDLLELLNVPAYKIASFELVDLALIERVLQTGKPLIISTGMGTLGEIQDAVDVIKSYDVPFVLLHCVSGYPTPAEEYNLHTMVDLGKRFDCLVGLSDHSLGNLTSVASVPLGAAVIEKHFTFRREDGGPDAAFSLEPAELKALCDDTRMAYGTLGFAGYDKKPSEEANVVFRRSLYVVKDMVDGEAFTSENVRCIRPGHGLLPKYMPNVLGRKAAGAIERGTALNWGLLEGGQHG